MGLMLYTRIRRRQARNSAALVLSYVLGAAGEGPPFRVRRPPADAPLRLVNEIPKVTWAILGGSTRGLLPGYQATARALSRLKIRRT